MSVVINSTYVISESQSGGGTINANNPVVGWHNLVTTSNITTTTAAAGFPATNMANPSTNLRWEGELSSPEEDEYITVVTGSTDPIDYLAVAKHNFGSASIPVSVEYLDLDASPIEWVELIADTLLPNDGPVLFRFPPAVITQIRLRMQPGSEAPTAAVVYVGRLLVLQRRLYVGHSPMPYGRTTKVTNARSESGNFLGRIVLNQMTGTSVALKNITPDWYRTNMEPFLLQAQEEPFFFAWRPSTYPLEVGYGWLTNDPRPTNTTQNGMMSVDLQMSGVV